MDDFVQSMRGAVDKAIQASAKPLGVYPIKVDDQLRAYRNMTHADFDLLAKEYGLPQTLNYIQRMETMRLEH